MMIDALSFTCTARLIQGRSKKRKNNNTTPHCILGHMEFGLQKAPLKYNVNLTFVVHSAVNMREPAEHYECYRIRCDSGISLERQCDAL